jgi:DNA-binding CsgD family transcriptional regulator
MTFSTDAERELVLALNREPLDPLSRQAFVDLLRQYTGASAACLQMRFGPAAPLRTITSHSSANGERPALDPDGAWPADLMAIEALRPNRVYALQELLDPTARPGLSAQSDALRSAGLVDARLLRVTSRGGHEAVVMVISARTPFDARDSVLLSALAPHVILSLENTALLATQQWRMVMAETALARLGIGQIALDANGRVVLADEYAAAALRVRAGARAPLGPAALSVLQASHDQDDPAERLLVTLDERAGSHMLLEPATRHDTSRIAAVGIFRRPPDLASPLPARQVAKILGISEREAALADALSRGKSILEAGESLHLTSETARNYTKRIYAKTGTKGQADLVRLLLTGLAPLA